MESRDFAYSASDPEQHDSLADEYNEESWLWCKRCRRFFQVKDIGRDSVGGRQGCSFEDCGGEGLGYDLIPWQRALQQYPGIAKWPRNVTELKRGLKVA